MNTELHGTNKASSPVGNYDDMDYFGIDSSVVETIRKHEYKKYRPLWIIPIAICTIIILFFILSTNGQSINFVYFLSLLFISVSFFTCFGIFISIISTLKVSQAVQLRIYCKLAELNKVGTELLLKRNEANAIPNTDNDTHTASNA